MRVIIDRTLFARPSPLESNNLARLMLDAACTSLQPPAVVLNPPYMPGEPSDDVDAWLDAQGPNQSAGFRDLLARGNIAFNGPVSVAVVDQSGPPGWRFTDAPEVRIERRGESDWSALRLTIHDAVELLREPTHLILENDRHDFAFVHYLAGVDGEELRSLRSAPGRLHLHGGGGGEAKRWLEALATPPATPEKWRRVLRTWVLFEQDAGEQDAREPSRDATTMMHICEGVHAAFPGVGLSWACLRRREIESYVPDVGLENEAPSNRRDMIETIKRWRGGSVDQKRCAWAFDLKKGLVGDLRAGLPKPDRDALKARSRLPTATDLKAPFNTLSNGDVDLLAYGLGEDRINDALISSPPPAWTADIPAEYDRGPSNQAPRAGLIQSLFDRI